MTKRLLVIATLALLAACGSKAAEPGKDWSGKPLDVTVKDKVNHVEFTLQVPAGMKRDDRYGKDEDLSKMWGADLADPWSEPTFMISYASIPATDVEGFVKDAMLGDTDIVAKQEATADGFVLVHHTKDKGLVAVQVMKIKGAHHLTCRAAQAKDGGVPSPDKTMAWLEQLCRSLTIL